MRRYAGPLILAALFALYIGAYVVAAALNVRPEDVFRAIFQGIGFGFGCVALFAVVLQIIRR